MTVEKKEIANKALDQLRKERNQEIVRKMRAGESLSSFDSQASWFPERPKIEKNLEAIQKLYGKASSGQTADSEKKGNLGTRPELETASVVPLARPKQKQPLDKPKT